MPVLTMAACEAHDPIRNFGTITASIGYRKLFVDKELRDTIHINASFYIGNFCPLTGHWLPENVPPPKKKRITQSILTEPFPYKQIHKKRRQHKTNCQQRQYYMINNGYKY